MPRPKRTKVAPSAPTIIPSIVGAKRMVDLEPLSASESVSSSRRTNTSDDSEGIITKSKTGVNRRGVAPQVATMSGALADEDMGEKKLKPLSSRRRLALSRIAREADHVKSVEVLKAQKEAAMAVERTAKEGEQPEVQVPSSQPAIGIRIVASNSSTQPSDISAKASQPPREIHLAKPRTTPSRETSILAIENFKRRPRQPSLLQIAQAHTAAQDSELDDTLDNFNPDDESTPLHQSNAGVQHERSSTSSSRKRKLSSPTIQVLSSQPPVSPDRSSSPVPSLSSNIFDIFEDNPQPNPPLPAIPASKAKSAQHTFDSDTLAPPHSSSPPNKSQQETRQSKARSKKSHSAPKPKGKATGTKARKTLSTPLPPRSPSPTQSSPATIPKSRSPLKPITTSALQNLLPRRRRVASKNKENNIYDLNTSSEILSFNAGEMDDHEDELSYHATARHHSGKTGAEKRKKKPGAGRPKKGKHIANGVASKTKGGKRLSATYTRKQNLEPEGNEDASSGSESDNAGSLLQDSKVKDEMKKMAAKFREVDDWGLEFEEVTGSSDRMRDAR
ncbi:MAG: hypothetical protein L6R41_004927 [Letrouitia leprolyta]|nr:MAG: hypothetical protein L6R41_004927 [Letrouitia leprolyta]